MMPFHTLVERELQRARTLYAAPLHSHHEAAAVIREEYDEYWDAVREKDHARDNLHLLKELIHTAAMCQRAAEDLGLLKGTPGGQDESDD